MVQHKSGWHHEPYRHSLASKGVGTSVKKGMKDWGKSGSTRRSVRSAFKGWKAHGKLPQFTIRGHPITILEESESFPGDLESNAVKIIMHKFTTPHGTEYATHEVIFPDEGGVPYLLLGNYFTDENAARQNYMERVMDERRRYGRAEGLGSMLKSAVKAGASKVRVEVKEFQKTHHKELENLKKEVKKDTSQVTKVLRQKREQLEHNIEDLERKYKAEQAKNRKKIQKLEQEMK